MGPKCQAGESEFPSTGSESLGGLNREMRTWPGPGLGKVCDSRLRRSQGTEVDKIAGQQCSELKLAAGSLPLSLQELEPLPLPLNLL